MVFAPRRLLGETYEIWTGDVVMVAYPASPHPGEEALGVIRVGLSLVAEAIGFLVIDPMQFIPGMERVPCRSLIGIKRGFGCDPLADEGERIRLVTEDAG
jgi:hypothetical protein